MWNSLRALLIDRLFIKQPRLRRLVTGILEKDVDREIDLCGTRLTINSRREHGYLRASRISQTSSFLRDELPVIINLAFLLKSADTFVDVGANVGCYSRTIARFAKLCPRMRIYAFEANPDTYRRLIESLPDSVQARQIAISDSAGTLEFVDGAVSHVFTTVNHAYRYNIKGNTSRVNSCRLDECGIEGDSLIIKIDVEGQEMEVLRGAIGLFESRRVKAVYIDGYEDRDVERQLERFGFHLFDGRTLEPIGGRVFSLLAIHAEQHSEMFAR